MRNRWAMFVALAVVAAALVAPGAASASTTEAIAGTGGMTLTMDGGASPLDIAVSLDSLGHITKVEVGGDAVAGDDDHRVRFSNEDDTTRVSVQAKNHKLAADVKAGALADILGVRVWSAPLFGSPDATTVAFEVIDNGGAPELVLGENAVMTDDDVEFVVGEVKNEVEGDEAESSVKVTFTKDGYTMTLKVQASVEPDDDDEGFTAKLKIVLRGKDVQNLKRVALEEVAGDHTWVGHLCDGTPVSVEYEITEGGDIAGIIVGPERIGHELKMMPHGFSVKFDDSKAKVTVDLKEKEDGTWDLKVRSKSTDKCNPSDDKDDKERGNSDKDDKDNKERGNSDKDKKKDDDDDDDDEDED